MTVSGTRVGLLEVTDEKGEVDYLVGLHYTLTDGRTVDLHLPHADALDLMELIAMTMNQYMRRKAVAAQFEIILNEYEDDEDYEEPYENRTIH
jgi:hypothetical protein